MKGLSRSSEYYSEAIECLKSHYNRPRLIHKAHVRMILEVPSATLFPQTIASFATKTFDLSPNCLVCKTEKHPLYACPRFKVFLHDQNVSTLKSNGVCMKCLKPRHFMKYYKSLHHCKACQKSHHTLLHIDNTPTSSAASTLHTTFTLQNGSGVPFWTVPGNGSLPRSHCIVPQAIIGQNYGRDLRMWRHATIIFLITFNKRT